MAYTSPPTDTDLVSFSSLHLAVAIGLDHWQRTRLQPVQLSVQLHLVPCHLNTPGLSDDVADSLHYGHLTKAVERRVSGKTKEVGYSSVRALLEDVADAAFGFARDVRREVDMLYGVRVILRLPKQILLAEGFEVELTTSVSDWTSGTAPSAGTIVRVTNLSLPVLIGVNPPERLAKQRVITHLTFFEAARNDSASVQTRELDYPAIIQQVVAASLMFYPTHGVLIGTWQVIESSSYFTLEKLVHEILRTAYRASDTHSDTDANHARIQVITVRCQKPSALSFADASEVEMTRTRESLGT